MTEQQQLDKAIAALKLGDVLLTNMNNEIKTLKAQKRELLDVLENLSFVAMTSIGTVGPDEKLQSVITNACELVKQLRS